MAGKKFALQGGVGKKNDEFAFYIPLYYSSLGNVKMRCVTWHYCSFVKVWECGACGEFERGFGIGCDGCDEW